MNFIVAILSLTLLTACASTEIITIEKTVVPSISFPIFPLAESMSDNKDGTVSVPYEWLVRLEEYHIMIEATEKTYNELKEIYKNEVKK